MRSCNNFNKNKYRAKKTEVDENVFHSKKEAKRYVELKEMILCNKIDTLELQPSFSMYVINEKGNKCIVGKYIADFAYMQDGKRVIEDVKGMRTPIYRLKKKIVEALYDIEIVEI